LLEIVISRPFTERRVLSITGLDHFFPLINCILISRPAGLSCKITSKRSDI
jgi:hypothetical protein